MNRKSVAKWINRVLAVGPSAALKDAYHRPKEPSITEEARAWVVSLACIKPQDLGYAAEMWTRSALANHVRSHAVEAGHPSLAKAVKATVQRILAEQPPHPERIKYYLERRDPQFDEKMKNVLLVYQAVALQNEERGRTDTPPLGSLPAQALFFTLTPLSYLPPPKSNAIRNSPEFLNALGGLGQDWQPILQGRAFVCWRTEKRSPGRRN